MWLKKDTLVAAITVGSVLSSAILGRAVFAKTAALEAVEIPEQEMTYVFNGSEIVKRDELPVIGELQELATTAASEPQQPNTTPTAADPTTNADIALIEAQLAEARRALAEAKAVASKPAPVLLKVTPTQTTRSTTQNAPSTQPSRTTRAS